MTHSTTKYMDGHAAAVGGAIVDSGNFDWMAHADKFPGLTTPDESYHGKIYAVDFGKAGLYHQGDGAPDARPGRHSRVRMNAFLLGLGSGDAGAAYGAPLQQCTGGGGVPEPA